MKIILLNGPPGSGKDTLANYLIRFDKTFVNTKFAHPIKNALKAFLELTDEEFEKFDNIQDLKNNPHPLTLDVSWRDGNIGLAELFVKKVYGEEAFGKLLVNKLRKKRIGKDSAWNLVVSDSGFDAETLPLIREFGAERISVIKLERKGHDYSKDSRGYINAKELGIDEYFLENKSGKQGEFERLGFNLIQSIKRGERPFTQSIFQENNLHNPEEKTTKKQGKKKTQ